MLDLNSRRCLSAIAVQRVGLDPQGFPLCKKLEAARPAAPRRLSRSYGESRVQLLTMIQMTFVKGAGVTVDSAPSAETGTEGSLSSGAFLGSPVAWLFAV
jgi:hypothetical protein